jgi:hypothetical protein
MDRARQEFAPSRLSLQIKWLVSATEYWNIIFFSSFPFLDTVCSAFTENYKPRVYISHIPNVMLNLGRKSFEQNEWRVLIHKIEQQAAECLTTENTQPLTQLRILVFKQFGGHHRSHTNLHVAHEDTIMRLNLRSSFRHALINMSETPHST